MRFYLAVLIFLVTSAICVSAAEEGRYSLGWLEIDYAAPLDDVYSAAEKALSSLGAMIEEQDKRIASAELRAVKGDRTYWVRLQGHADDSTAVAVRAGLSGSRAAAQLIHRRITEALRRAPSETNVK